MYENRQVLFGTAGWSYLDWEGTVYPARIPRGFNQLEFLAREKKMDFVEVNTSFYRIPPEKMAEGWINKIGGIDHFGFWIKIHQNFTHKQTLIKNELNAFLKFLGPLIREKKLLGLLAQFPYSFKFTSQNLKYLDMIFQIFGRYNLVIEFRHKSWNCTEIIDRFREQAVIWANIDQPVISESLPLTSISTHPKIAYIRIHGRNYQHWFSNSGRDARYDYDYSESELIEINREIDRLKKLAKKVFISGNNHYKGAAVKNLIQLKKMGLLNVQAK